MKKHIQKISALALCLLLVFSFNVNAQITVTVGTGIASTGSNGSPTAYPCYYTSGRVQYLILASELNALGLNGATYMNSLAFNVQAASTSTVCTTLTAGQILNYNIKLKNTTVSSSAAGAFDFTGLTQVYTSPTSFTPVNGWNTYIFNSPFLWDGVSNLLVDVCSDESGGVCAYTCYTYTPSIFYTTTTFNSTNFCWFDGQGSACTMTSSTNSCSYAPSMNTLYTQRADMQFTCTPYNNSIYAKLPPIANFAYNITTDTLWYNSPFIHINTSNYATSNYWDIVGYSTSYNGVYTPYTPPSGRVCATRWNTCYMDTMNNNFNWKYTQPGYYKVKLKVANKNGVDSITKIVVCVPPTHKPSANFFSSYNSVGFNDLLSYYDVSSNGPSAWKWFLKKDGNLYQNSQNPNQWTTSDSIQNPFLKAYDGGVFDVCLAAGNSQGWDTMCKHNYLTVNNGYSMCNGTDSVSFLPSGYVYDAGGPTGNYTGAATGTCSKGFRIAPCADNINLTIERLKMLVGDSITIYAGSNSSGTKIKTIGGPGIPDSLRNFQIQGGFAFIQMNVVSSSLGDSGIAIHWTSTPASYSKPKAGFSMSTNGPLVNGVPSVYKGYTVQYTNTSTGTNMGYSWDTNGDGIQDFTGTNASWVSNTLGLTNICLRVSNCIGYDSVCKQLQVLPIPSKPIADFTSNKLSGFTTDTIIFTDKSLNGSMSWQWSFSPTNVTYLNGTSSTSQNPVVFFNSATCYTVSFTSTNSIGSDTKTNTCMINVVGYNSPGSAYVIPTGSDIGISRVTLANLDVGTDLQTPIYAQMNNLQATLYKGVDYTVSTYRYTNNDPMTTKVWIDYNMNAVFTDSGETIINEKSQNKISTSKTFRIPGNTPVGNTRMRVGITYDSTSLTPDQAKLGCFEDYGIIIGLDNVKPVLSLIGSSVYKMQAGKHYTEQGVTATDNLEGDISSRFVRTGYLDTNTIGYYTLTYTVSDLYGNTSLPVTRTVQVEVNQKGPTITLNGSDTVKVGVGYAYIEQGATASDNLGNNISNLITISGSVNSSQLSNYPVSYSVIDAFGFTATKIRTVMVVDTTKPVIISSNGKTGTDTVRYQIGTPFIDASVISAWDNYYTNIQITRTGTVNVNASGYYTLIYNATDGSGNQATPFKLVVKVDNTIMPTISLIGDPSMVSDVNTPFTDPGVNYNSTYYSYGSLLATTTSNMDITKLGTYVINYCVSDPSNNTACVSRNVQIVDRRKPLLSLIGDNPYILPRYQAFVDLGISISDNYYTEAQLKPLLIIDSKIINDVPGVYYVTYNLTDPSGNKSNQVKRTVIVEDMFLGINNLNNGGKMTIYPNPSNGKFIIDLENGTSVQSVKVYSMIGSLVKDISLTGKSKTIEVDMTGVNEGMYIVRIEGAGKSFTQKINIVK